MTIAELHAELEMVRAELEGTRAANDQVWARVKRAETERDALKVRVDELSKFDLERAKRWSAEAMALKARVAELEGADASHWPWDRDCCGTCDERVAAQHEARGAAAERAAIVGMLRNLSGMDEERDSWCDYFASLIERGDHLAPATEGA